MSIEPYYQSEKVKLYCGDCLEILPSLSGVDAVVTDPPYGIQHLMKGGTWAKNNVYINDGAAWDSSPVNDTTLAAAIAAAPKAIVWGGNYFNLPPSRCWLVWSKPERNFTMAEAELAWTNIEAPVRVIDCPRLGKRPEHPTQKPVEVMRFCLDRMNLGPVILDPFAGSGTTLVAAIQSGRRAIGIEIDPGYCKIAKRRIQEAEQAFALFEPAIPEKQVEMF